jgi:hypothetical protein
MIRRVISLAALFVSFGYAQAQNGISVTPGQIVKWFNMFGQQTDSIITESPDGNIGIGTMMPNGKLTIYNSGATTQVFENLKNDTHEVLIGVDVAAIVSAITASDLQLRTNNLNRMVLKANSGYVGIGTNNPQAPLHVAGGAWIDLNSSGGGKLVISNNPNDNRIYIEGWGRDGVLNPDEMLITGQFPYSLPRLTLLADTAYVTGNVGIGVSNPVAKLDVAGMVKANAIQISAADFSEKFEVRETKGRGEPGMVVAIDPGNPGQLVLSTTAYNRRVAGVLSGAGGIKPGMLMGQPGTLADGDQAVALSGRVYVWADASNGPIVPGDLLTTSSKPGHAMKVTDYRKAQGATIGKAMTELREGRGLVLTLVTLQ